MSSTLPPPPQPPGLWLPRLQGEPRVISVLFRAGRLPPSQLVGLQAAGSRRGATCGPPPPLRSTWTSCRSAGAPQAAPGLVTCLPPRGQPPSAPFCLNHCNTCTANPTLAFLQHLPLLFFPSPSLQPWPWSLQLQRKHTHTHAQNQLWNVFLLLSRVDGSREFSEHLTSPCISTPQGMYSPWELGLGAGCE